MKKLLKNLLKKFQGNSPAHDPNQTLCPQCRTQLKELLGLGAWRCATCRGIWVDLERLSGFLWAPEDQLSGILNDRVEESLTFSPSPRRPCVRCSRPMENYLYDENHTLWVDACGQGHGIWFDSGEVALARQINEEQEGS